MNQYEPEDLAEIRRKLVELEFHAKSNEAFLERLRLDPVAVLHERGFTDPLTQQVVDQLRGDATAGSPGGWCDAITCLVTGCSFFTANPPE